MAVVLAASIASLSCSGIDCPSTRVLGEVAERRKCTDRALLVKVSLAHSQESRLYLVAG